MGNTSSTAQKTKKGARTFMRPVQLRALLSSQRTSRSRTRPTATRTPTCYTVSKCHVKKCGFRAATKKNKEARRVARSETGVGGVIERMGSGQEWKSWQLEREEIEKV